jgi:hypothetical protein
MKLLFLDIDGVLNSICFYIYRNKCTTYDEKYKHFFGKGIPFKDIKNEFYTDEIDERALNLLSWLLKKFDDLKIVISSSWKKRGEDIVGHLLKEKYGLDRIIGVTPYCDSRYRGDEIKEWLDNADIEIETFVIVDDDSDMEPFKDRLVKTNNVYGLTGMDVDKIEEMFMGQ